MLGFSDMYGFVFCGTKGEVTYHPLPIYIGIFRGLLQCLTQERLLSRGGDAEIRLEYVGQAGSAMGGY